MIARLINCRNLVFGLLASMGLSCDECVELNANEYGFEGNSVYLKYLFPSPGNVYSNFHLLENNFTGSLPDSTGNNTLTIYPFSPTNTFVLTGMSDTDTVYLHEINYSLYNAGKCGLGIEVDKPLLEHSFDSTRIRYIAFSNAFEIFIYKP